MNAAETAGNVSQKERGGLLAAELRDRLSRPGWWIAYAASLGASFVAALVLAVFSGLSSGDGSGFAFSGAVFAVLAVGLVTLPFLAGATLNGARGRAAPGGAAPASAAPGGPPPAGAAPVATVLRGWISRILLALGLLVAAAPVLVVSAVAGGVSFATFVSALGMVVLELGLVAAIAVGLSGIVRRAALSRALSAAVVLLLAVGTAAAAQLAASTKDVTETVRSLEVDFDGDSDELVCLEPTVVTTITPMSFPNWALLAVNPFVVVADASAGDTTESGSARDAFGRTAETVRQAREPLPVERVEYSCGEEDGIEVPETPRQEWGAPVWYVGAVVHVVLAALALGGAVLVLRRRHHGGSSGPSEISQA